MQNLSVILAAAGRSTRFGGGQTKKVFADLSGKPVWLRSAEAFYALDFVSQIVMVVSEDDYDFFLQRFAPEIDRLKLEVVVGGAERYLSVKNGIAKIVSDTKWVAIHDAARPMIQPSQISEVFDAAKKNGAAILAAPMTATIKKVMPDSQLVLGTVDRTNLFSAQTPQIFQRQQLLDIYEKLQQDEQQNIPTDECLLMESFGVPVAVVSGDDQNLKITQQNDMVLAKAILAARIEHQGS